MSNQLDTRVARLEGRLDALERQVNAITSGNYFSFSASETNSKDAIIATLTTKQHVTLQMLMRGASNAAIAERLGVSENTAKVHVRGIAKKFGVHSRSQIVMQAFPEYEAIPASTYEAVSGGIPKAWAEEYMDKAVKHDPHRKLYKD